MALPPGLTVVVAELIDELGWEMLCLMTIAAGALQILFGVSRMARSALAIAPVVVHAMLAGIGITIVLQQFHVLIGGKSYSSAWQNLVAIPNGILHHELHEVIVGGTVIGILLLWGKLPPKIAHDSRRPGGHRCRDGAGQGPRTGCRAHLTVGELLRRHRLAPAFQ